MIRRGPETPVPTAREESRNDRDGIVHDDTGPLAGACVRFKGTDRFTLYARRLVARGGRLVAMKGLFPHEELRELPPDIVVAEVPAIRVPGLDGQRHLVIMEPRVP